PEDHVRYVAKQRISNEETYNERIADFKDWYNEKVYTSLENLYKLYFELASQEEVVKKRSKEEIDNILQRIHGLEI
ncbi:2603_t:CDS:1, partial [Racocetra persica]